VKQAESGQTSLGLFDQSNEAEEALSAKAPDTVKQAPAAVAANDYPD
jgi:hypothetical protein